MRILSLSLTPREADFIWQALIDFRYENYTYFPLDYAQPREDFRVLSMRLQEKLKNMFPDVPRPHPIGHHRNRTKYGRRRKLR
jgi:hypothetical protein